MQRLSLIVLILVLIVGSLYLGFAGSSRPDLEPIKPAVIGDDAPDFTLKDLEGKEYSLSALRGKVVLVNFWATWCPPCRAEIPSMEKLSVLMKDENFVMLAVNVEPDGRSTVPKFFENRPHSFPVLFDEEGVVQKLYGVFKFPETFVVRKDGVIDDKVIGAIDWAHPDTVTYFKELIKAKG